MVLVFVDQSAMESVTAPKIHKPSQIIVTRSDGLAAKMQRRDQWADNRARQPRRKGQKSKWLAEAIA